MHVLGRTRPEFNRDQSPHNARVSCKLSAQAVSLRSSCAGSELAFSWVQSLQLSLKLELCRSLVLELKARASLVRAHRLRRL